MLKRKLLGNIQYLIIGNELLRLLVIPSNNGKKHISYGTVTIVPTIKLRPIKFFTLYNGKSRHFTSYYNLAKRYCGPKAP